MTTGPTGPSTLLRRCTRYPTRLPILNGSHAWISEDGTGSAAPSTSTIMPLDQHG
jgi:hypothetical protein